MRSVRGSRGRFCALYGTTTLRLSPSFAYPPGQPRYQILVLDRFGDVIVPLNEWYLRMEGIGAARTRDTYLALLRPYFGFLAERGYAWNARPEAVRENTRVFLQEAGCALQAGRVEGWFVRATNRLPLSSSGLHLLIAALRCFYAVMRRGVFDPETEEFHPYYAYQNPMYSDVLLAWRAQHRKWIRNRAAPDVSGIRSEPRSATAREPVGYFQVKRSPLEPAVARDSEPIRLVILAGVQYMIDHAAARETVILRMLLESGARVSEVLGLTAANLRQAHNPVVGIRVGAVVRGKGDLVACKPIWFSEETRERLRHYIARERSKLDRRGRARLEQLEDDEPIFLSRRRRQLGYSGFRIYWRRLLRSAQRHFGSGSQPVGRAVVPLPPITPHTIRHLHTTFRVLKLRELFPQKSERERAMEALVNDIGWRSAETIKIYDHAITRAEYKELMADAVHQMLVDAPHDRASLAALLGRGPGPNQPSSDDVNDANGQPELTDEARITLAWLNDMAHP